MCCAVHAHSHEQRGGAHHCIPTQGHSEQLRRPPQELDGLAIVTVSRAAPVDDLIMGNLQTQNRAPKKQPDSQACSEPCELLQQDASAQMIMPTMRSLNYHDADLAVLCIQPQADGLGFQSWTAQASRLAKIT